MSMSFKLFDSPSFEEVKNSINTHALANVNYNEVSGNWNYIQDANISYPFGSKSPNDKNIKLYRVIISK